MKKEKQRTIKQSRVAELVLSAISAVIFGSLTVLEHDHPPAFYFFLALTIAALGSTVNTLWILIKNKNGKEKSSE